MDKQNFRLTNSRSIAALRTTASSPTAGVFILYARKSTEGEERQVQSIDDQTRHCQIMADAQNLSVAYDIAEAHSAKRHGTRPGFREMIDRIETGEADSILAWHPDRLARNAIDGGWILDLLDRGKLRHLRFAAYTFENTPEGKMMLGMIFSQAKYQVDKLTVDVQRGMDTKREQGWFPHRVGEGYKNDLETHTVVVDPVRFPLLRRTIELILAGTHRPSEALHILNDEWGYRTRATKRNGGGPLSRSGFYHILSNPFYYGVCREGKLSYAGAHPPLMSRGEFRQIQERLSSVGKQKPKLHAHPFTGLIRCGHCGCAVTASRVKGHVYYHCTDRRGVCTKAGIRGEALEAQFLDYFDRLSIPAWLEPELVQIVYRNLNEEPDRKADAAASRQAALEAARNEQRALRGMRRRELVTDAEYLEDNSRLSEEIKGLELAAQTNSQETTRRQETAASVLAYAVWGRQTFLEAAPSEKRRLAGLLGGKLLLADRQLTVELNPYLALLTEYHDALQGPGEISPMEEKHTSDGSRLDNAGLMIKPGISGSRGLKQRFPTGHVFAGPNVLVQTVKIGSESTKTASWGETVCVGSPSKTTFKLSDVKLLAEIGTSLAQRINAGDTEFGSEVTALLHQVRSEHRLN